MSTSKPTRFARRRSVIAALALMLACGAGAHLRAEEKPAEADAAVAKSADSSAKTSAAGLELFRKDVRVILAHRCVECHGGSDTEAEFDLTTREGILKGGESGKPGLVPGSPEKSRLYALVTHAAKPHMPDGKDKLPEAEIAKIAAWIEAGAPYDRPLIDPESKDTPWTERKIAPDAGQWWAFAPLKRVEPPAVKQTHWPRTPIDQFVLARLEAKGLTPGAPADRRTLIRRAYFDLIGLPPQPEAVEAFVADKDPRAWERLIDRLLESTHYGERWGRHWLDVARFAESHGFEQDYDRPYAYHYRDFVIRALNQDMPFDQFVQWQLAGDELAPDDPLANMATGFLGAGVFPTQITAKEVERTRYDALDDMLATTGTAMLGMTIGCARCHDHKFDPIPQGDYYRMLSTFTTTVRSNVELNLDPEGYRQSKAVWEKEHAPLTAALEKFEREQLPGRFAQWEAAGNKPAPSTWLVLGPSKIESAGGATFSEQPGGSWLASGKNPDFDTYTIVARTDLRDITGLRVEALADKSLVRGGPGRADNGNIALTDVSMRAAPADGGNHVEVKFATAQATFEQPGLAVTNAIDGDKKSGWAVDPQFGKDHAAVFETEGVVGFEGGTVLTVALAFNNNVRHNIGRLRLAVTAAPRPVGLEGNALPAHVAAAFAVDRNKRTAEQAAALVSWYKTRDEQWQALHRAVAEHQKSAPKPKLTTVMIASEGVKPIRHHTQGADFFEKTYYLRRGDCDQKEEVAPQSFLQVLMRHPDGFKHWQKSPPQGWRTSYRRASLAAWITDTQYGAGHLLARVIVNRLWQHHLGRGIVATPNDFGRQGPPPTHPQLLDWLAQDLIDGGWQLKRLHKRIMTSAVYMQSSQRSEANTGIDPVNQWLWRYEPRRLEAEIIRDAMLAVGGRLDRRQFGPGTLDESHTRRSIYFMIKRSKLIGTMVLFDQPEPLASVGGRPSTTIAPQALHFLNSSQVRQCAEGLARRAEEFSGKQREIAEIIRQAYRLALSRSPGDSELADAEKFIAAQAQSYGQQNKEKSRQQALVDFCQVLLGLNEFVYVE